LVIRVESDAGSVSRIALSTKAASALSGEAIPFAAVVFARRRAYDRPS